MEITVFWDICRVGLIFDSEDWRRVSLKRQLTFTGLHGDTSQKVELSFTSDWEL
jgi:hypothetical protein